VETLRQVVVYLHLIGFALLLGGAVAQYLTRQLRINQAMLGGAVLQVLTGLVLAAPWGLAPGEKLSYAKLAVKLVVALMILAMTFFPRNRENVNRGHFLAIVAFVLVNAGVAVFW
jgi:uncharacterized membrane protein